MNKKIKLVGALTILLLTGGQVFGAVGYSRDPSGYTINNPVSFEISFDDYSEMCDILDFDYWSLYIQSEFPENYQEIFSDWIEPTTKNYTFVETLPIGKYTEIKYACCSTIEQECEDRDTFEYVPWTEGGIFEVVEATTPTFFSADGESMMLASVALIGELFTDVLPALVAGLGMSLGLTYVIPKVIYVLKNLR